MKTTTIFLSILLLSLLVPNFAAAQEIRHPKIGAEAEATDGLKIKLVGKHQHFSSSTQGWDEDINSPKSINIHPDGSKYYVNSLEGCRTIAYDMKTHKKLTVIKHSFNGSETTLWAEPSGLYNFTHYKASNAFDGKPVESTFTHNGRYLWVPYYRRSFDINAQDPSAIAVIDTRTDKIIRMFETGPLPKMIATSYDGKTVAVSHWGNNTVALLDVSGDDPTKWHHTKMLVVDYILPLNFSTTSSVDRDNGSGYALRGTVFTPDDNYLLVGCMGGDGGVAVIDLKNGKYLGRVMGMMPNVRHLVISNGNLYLSINAAGCIQRISLDKFLNTARTMDGTTKKKVNLGGWETCKVGTGARTLELPPSGRYAFAACNNASKLCVVDTRTMRQITSIDVDSYPVGLDISDDGKYVIVTSQGRSGGGGNAVNIYEVSYPEPEVTSLDGCKDEMSVTPENATEADTIQNNADHTSEAGILTTDNLIYAGCGAACLALATIGICALKKKRG